MRSALLLLFTLIGLVVYLMVVYLKCGQRVVADERADLYVTSSTFDSFYLDTTTSSISVLSNAKVNGIPGLLTSQCEKRKQKIFDKYEHMPGQLRAAGFDSCGGFGVQAVKTIALMFKRPKHVSFETTSYDRLRLFYKKRLIDLVSIKIHGASIKRRLNLAYQSNLASRMTQA